MADVKVLLCLSSELKRNRAYDEKGTDVPRLAGAFLYTDYFSPCATFICILLLATIRVICFVRRSKGRESHKLAISSTVAPGWALWECCACIHDGIHRDCRTEMPAYLSRNPAAAYASILAGKGGVGLASLRVGTLPEGQGRVRRRWA